ncbi:hypothetical protein T07_9928 [Trichinella nelsoni]|uniref:Uncharacterized protein n=1 Tax=Trichinella nelsoni TaxID=6336 RepID=A0A0V0S4H6_9BILA|nr:hypothetical protein T07_9928 [Trichinella nelsoni]
MIIENIEIYRIYVLYRLTTFIQLLRLNLTSFVWTITIYWIHQFDIYHQVFTQFPDNRGNFQIRKCLLSRITTDANTTKHNTIYLLITELLSLYVGIQTTVTVQSSIAWPPVALIFCRRTIFLRSIYR